MSVATITSADRLSSCLIFAFIFHLVMILGIGFAIPTSNTKSNNELLEVTLVNHASLNKPKKADYIAQSNQKGGGNTEEKVKPTHAVTGLIPLANNGVSPVSKRKSSSINQREQKALLMNSKSAFEFLLVMAEKASKDDNADVVKRAEIELNAAKLAAEVAERKQTYAKRPKRKYVSASTMESKYAQYMQSWVKKVERVGNLNYPNQSSQQQIFGELLLSVAIRHNGTIEKVTLINSSGYDVLDEAAINIVKMSSPFDKLSDEITQETDILHITRTWQFLPGSKLRSK